MDAPQDLPEPQVLTDLMGMVVKLFVAFGAVTLGGMSWVWSVARSAKRCAFDARLMVERADVSAGTTTKAIDGLHEDMTKGFNEIHKRLDRHLEKH